jgi:type VI protein secretion system component Hcp
MATKAKKTAKLHKSKKLEAQKPLQVNHGDFSITKHVDSSSPS